MNEDWQILSSFFPDKWKELAVATNTIKGLRKGKDAENYLRTLLLHIGCGYSMRETVARAKLANLADISDVALLKRLRTLCVNTRSLIIQNLNGSKFPLLEKVMKIRKAGAMRSWHVQIPGRKSSVVKGRICVIRKTEEAIKIAQSKLKRIAQKKGQSLKPETIEYAKYVIVFTTFPEESFSDTDILEWYRVRWQVELVFKRFKSIAHVGHLPKYNDDSSKAWLYGKLFVALLTEKLIDHAASISPWGYFLEKQSTTECVA